MTTALEYTMMLFRLMLAVSLAAFPALAERHNLSQFTTQTDEGKALQAISTEQDVNRKLALMEEFASKYPKHEGTSWVLYQMQTEALKANQFDKATEAGEKLLAMDLLDVDAAYNNIKAAEGKKDTTAIIKWAQITSTLAHKAESGEKGPQESEEDHKKAIEAAKKLITVQRLCTLERGSHRNRSGESDGCCGRPRGAESHQSISGGCAPQVRLRSASD